jgi:dihydroorotate dehydrogenase (NAD+) catalytic subunit
MTRAVIRRRPRPARAVEPTVDMTTDLVGVELPSPVLTASGCAGAGRELDQFFDITAIGAIVTKSVMLQPRSGRPTPRMAETPSGMLNSIGLQGPGIEAFLDRDLAWLQERGARVVLSIAGGSVDEYAKLAQKLRHVPDLVAIEVNISCPNVEDRGQVFACDPDASFAVVHAVRRNSDPRVPVLAKLSPDVTDIVAIAARCVEAGATGLSMINTTLGMVIDTDTLRPALAGVTGGLSGPAIRPIAVRCVWQVRQALPDIPILGMGGIRTGLDALEFILAGASAVSVGTVVFNDPSAPLRIHRELARALDERGFDRLVDAVSYAHRPPGDEPEPTPEPEPVPTPVTGPRLAAAETGSLGRVAGGGDPARPAGPGRPATARRPDPRVARGEFGGGFVEPPPPAPTDPDQPFDQESDW